MRQPTKIATMKSPLAYLALALGLSWPLTPWAQISVSIRIAPPPLRRVIQPLAPGDGYIWTPGHWSWGRADRRYHWVPGAWMQAPHECDLWTPGYWASEKAGYVWHDGYWGPQVGFYGGINYGHGYSGSGYKGGRWENGIFSYNRAVSHVNTRIVQKAYSAPDRHDQRSNTVSFHGGKAGTKARPPANEAPRNGGVHPERQDDKPHKER
jgi:hypothetical protein